MTNTKGSNNSMKEKHSPLSLKTIILFISYTRKEDEIHASRNIVNTLCHRDKSSCDKFRIYLHFLNNI